MRSPPPYATPPRKTCVLLQTLGRCIALLDEASKKKNLIARGAAAGFDRTLRDALFLTDTTNVDEEDIFGDQELMSKLSAALESTTKRKRIKGRPLAVIPATVKNEGSLPAYLQARNTSTPTTPTAAEGLSTAASSKTGNDETKPAGVCADSSDGSGDGSGSKEGCSSSSSIRGGGSGDRRQIRPLKRFEGIATSNEEYVANVEHAYGSTESATSVALATVGLSPALSGVGISGHSSGADLISSTGIQQQHQQQLYERHYVSGPLLTQIAQARGGCVKSDNSLQGPRLDNPTSTCTSLVISTTPNGTEHRFPATDFSSQELLQAKGTDGNGAFSAAGVPQQEPPSLLRYPGSLGTAGRSDAGDHWVGQKRRSLAGRQHQKCQPKPEKRLCNMSSPASRDVGSLRMSHPIKFDNDGDTEVSPYGHPCHSELAGDVRHLPCGPGAGGRRRRVTREDLRELEEELLTDGLAGEMDGMLYGDTTSGAIPNVDGSETMGVPGLL